MKEYQSLLDKYCSDRFFLYTQTVPEIEWGNNEAAYSYMEKYWLNYDEYKIEILPRMNKIFVNMCNTLPDIMFNNSYEIFALRGGRLFTQYDFEILQRLMRQLGNKYFFIIEMGIIIT